MSFNSFLKKLETYYRGNENAAAFTRSVFVSVTANKQDDFLPSEDSFSKIYSGNDITHRIAQKVLSSLDKEGFIEFLNKPTSDSIDEMKVSFGLDNVPNVDDFYERLYEMFIGYLKIASDKKRSTIDTVADTEFSSDYVHNKAVDLNTMPVSTFAQIINSIQEKEKGHRNPFHYLNVNMGFYGREKEYESFKSFLMSDTQFSVLAISGYSGSGKSKFTLEAIAQITAEKLNWKFVYLDRLLIDDFSAKAYESFKYEQPLCFVVDYAGRHSEKIGKIISRIASTHTEALPSKIRILLIERQGITRQGVGDEILPDWFHRMANACDASIPLFGSGFLEVAELSECSLKLIALDYRNENGIGIMQKYENDKTRFEEEWGKITEILNRRGTLSAKARTIRPLIVLFMIDSSIRNLDYYKCDIDEILKKIIERYEKHWENNLCAGDNQLFKAVQKLLMYSTACEPWNVGELVVGMEAESELLNELGREKLSRILPYVNEFDIYDEQMLAFEPDLLGEFFVLKMLKNISSPTKRKELIKLFWNADAESFAFFLQMCVYDYSYSEYFKEIFENFNELFLSQDGFGANSNSSEIIAGLLLEITYVGVPHRTKNAIETLGKLMEGGKKDEYLALRYVTGISNRIIDAGAKEGGELIKEIRRVADKYEDVGSIFGTYCEAVYNTIALEFSTISEDDAGKVLNAKIAHISNLLDTLLDFLAERADTGEEFDATAAIYFSKCIQNPMLILKRRACVTYLQKAITFIEKSQTDLAFGEFTDALANFSSRDDIRVDDIKPFYESLKSWLQAFEENWDEKFHAHAQILTNLTNKGEDTELWLAEIKELYEKDYNEYVAQHYAMALCNFTHIKADAADAEIADFEEAICKIKNLMRVHNQTGIATWYCKALVNQFYFYRDVSVQDGIGIAYKLTESLVANFTDENIGECEDLVVAFTHISMVYCEESCDINGIEEFVTMLKKLRDSFPDVVQFVECIAFAYMCIANICAENDTPKAITATNEIRPLHDKHSDNEFIADFLSDAVSAISAFMPSNEIEGELPKMAEIHENFPQSESIATSYLMVIRNLTAECDNDIIEPWFNKALRTYRKHPNEDDLLESCFEIVFNFLTETHDLVKATTMHNALKKVRDFHKIESDSCKTAYDDLMRRFKEIRELDDE